MTDFEKLISVRNDNVSRESFINENTGFICRCASKASGRFIDKSEDIYSEALIAFNDAINSYNSEKGEFTSFAAAVIHNRVIDYLKKENRFNNIVPFSSLSNENDNGDDVSFDTADNNNSLSDTAIEVFSLKDELKKFDISFFDLAKASPKTKKTRTACIEVINFIIADNTLLQSVYDKGCLPLSQIHQSLKINKKNNRTLQKIHNCRNYYN